MVEVQLDSQHDFLASSFWVSGMSAFRYIHVREKVHIKLIQSLNDTLC